MESDWRQFCLICASLGGTNNVQGVSHMRPSISPVETAHTGQSLSGEASTNHQIFAAQVRLLYGNLNVGVGVTLVAAPILGRFQWDAVPHPNILGWCLYMFLVSAARFTLRRQYMRTTPSTLKTST